MNSLYEVQIRKDINEFDKCKTQHWMETEYDENVLEYWRLTNGKYIVKLKKTMDSMVKMTKSYITKSSRSFHIK